MPGVDLAPTAAAPPVRPDYDGLQKAFHRAFRDALYAVADGLPVSPGGAVLDAPCGGGFYAHRLAARVGPAGGRVTAVDLDPAYLAETHARLADVPAGWWQVARGNVYALPFPADSFDVVWCAQSLISITDPVRALAEFRRVLKPGGLVAVLEGDEFHHVLVPWPVEVEVGLAGALKAACERVFGDATRTSPARRLRADLTAAGFADITRTTHAADFVAPFPPAVAEFLLAHAVYLREFLRDDLPAAVRPVFDRLTAPDSADAFFRRPDAEVTCLNAVYTGRKAG